MKVTDFVKVKGTTRMGVIIREKLIRASETGRGVFGDVKIFTVVFQDGIEMEYEQTELSIENKPRPHWR